LASEKEKREGESGHSKVGRKERMSGPAGRGDGQRPKMRRGGPVGLDEQEKGKWLFLL
jgi:hypothetical protein